MSKEGDFCAGSGEPVGRAKLSGTAQRRRRLLRATELRGGVGPQHQDVEQERLGVGHRLRRRQGVERVRELTSRIEEAGPLHMQHRQPRIEHLCGGQFPFRLLPLLQADREVGPEQAGIRTARVERNGLVQERFRQLEFAPLQMNPCRKGACVDVGRIELTGALEGSQRVSLFAVGRQRDALVQIGGGGAPLLVVRRRPA